MLKSYSGHAKMARIVLTTNTVSFSYCPPLVKIPMDPTQPEYTKSFTTDQVDEYQQVRKP